MGNARPFSKLELIKQLRDETGLGLAEAKAIIDESDGDLDIARSLAGDAGISVNSKDWRDLLHERFVSASDMNTASLPPLSANSSNQILMLLHHFEESLKSGANPPRTSLLRLKSMHAATVLSTSDPEVVSKLKEFLSVAVEIQGQSSRYIAVLRLRPLGSVVTCSIEHKEILDPFTFAVQGVFYWLFAFSKDKDNEARIRERNPEHKSSSMGVFIGMCLLIALFAAVAQLVAPGALQGTALLVPAFIFALIVLGVIDAMYKRKMKELGELNQAAVLWMANSFEDAMGHYATGKPIGEQRTVKQDKGGGIKRRRD